MTSSLRLPLLIALLSAPWVAQGQIELSTKLDYAVYLQFEPLIVRTTVKSSIGQATVYNAEPEGPNFYLQVNDNFGHQLPPLPDAKVPEPVMVPAQVTVNFTNNMLHHYNLAKPGFYSIQPCVDWMGKKYTGEKKHIEVVSGREVMRVTGRVTSDGSTRTYKILHVNRRQQDHILLRIDDENANLCFGVFALGRSIMNEKPELVVDASGNAHILFKSSPQLYNHITYTPHGDLIGHQEFGNEYNTITLKTQADGSVESIGSREGKAAPRPIETLIGK